MKRIVLLFIIILGVILRLYMLSSLPPSLTWDEASWGYNAYSLSIDGRDEFGRVPITYLQSFGDYKPPVYAYLTVPFVKILGLNEFSVRLPSALLGAATILLTYLLTKKIFNSASEKKKEVVALLASLVLAISPWHIMLSRAAFEANIATFFIVLGVYLFFVSFEKKWTLPLSVLSFMLSMYTFNTSRVFVPLLGIFLFFRYLKELLRDKRAFALSLVFGFLLFLPLFLFLVTPEARLRYKEVNIFSDQSIVIRANQQMENNENALWSRLVHNRRVGYALSYAKHYLDNFDPQFLFIRGDGNPKFSIQDVGQLYIWEIPFLVLGILFIFRKREGYSMIIPFWILLGIIPAGVARETPHALRVETVLPTFQILTAYGLYHAYGFFNRKLFKIHTALAFVLLILFLAIFNFFYFTHNYLAHYPKEFSSEWQYGYRETIKFIAENSSSYDKVHITNALGRPYIYFLFYTKYPPEKFREDSTVYEDAAGFTHVSSIGKYMFEDNLSEKVDISERNLFVDVPRNLPPKIKILKDFRRLDGSVALVAYERITSDEESK